MKFLSSPVLTHSGQGRLQISILLLGLMVNSGSPAELCCQTAVPFPPLEFPCSGILTDTFILGVGSRSSLRQCKCCKHYDKYSWAKPPQMEGGSEATSWMQYILHLLLWSLTWLTAAQYQGNERQPRGYEPVNLISVTD